MLKRKLWKNKWFILVMCLTLFLALTATRVMAAGTDVQLEKVLTAATNGLKEYFKFLIDVLTLIW